jgi:hypothetical protein
LSTTLVITHNRPRGLRKKRRMRSRRRRRRRRRRL